MASAGGGEEPAPIPEPNSWKGHPQPPPEERLLAARYFLADEDPDRCLDFASRINEIEEYVAYLESGIKLGTIQCDHDLLRDVKVKLAVHRDWEQRRRDRIPDIGCDGKPWLLPYSTRTSASQAPARPNPVRAATGFPIQVREDHPPFSVRREDDHAAFIAALKKDASGDPDEVDVETNLLYTESQAYSWALQEPILIPSWMHPTQGIPKKGLSPADPTPWYRKPTVVDPADTEQYRPTRGWIPGYLLARERRINSFLTRSDLSHNKMSELEDLLHFIEPPELRRLHVETIAFDKDDALGLVTEAEQEYRQKVSDAFAAEQHKWLSTFTDVYFILKPTIHGAFKSEQPGVFYIDHGVLNPERQATLEKANDLLTQISAAGYSLNDLGDEDLVALEVFLQFSQPISLTHLSRRRAAILRQAGANFKEDLEQADAQRYEEIHRAEHVQRADWLKSLAINNPEFQYLRPGEMPEVPENPDLPQVLYIPWEVASVPTIKSPILLEAALPASVQKLQGTLRFNLGITKDQDKIPDGNVGNAMIRQYLQVAYPELRILGAQWLLYRMMSDKGALALEDERLKKILDPIFIQKFKNWRYGLLGDGDPLTIKMPRLNQEDERPGILYCRNTIGDCNDEEDKLRIQALLDLGPNRRPHDTQELHDVLIKFQYPALRRLHGEYDFVVKQGKPSYSLRGPRKKRWTDMMNRWIRTLEGSIIEIKKPNTRTDPDNDPTIVYYRGLIRPSSYPSMSPEQMNLLNHHLATNQALEEFHLFGDAPPVIQKAFRKYKNTKRPEDGLLYAFQLSSWHLSSEEATYSEIDDSMSETTSIATMDGHEECAQSLTASGKQGGNTLGIDLNLLLLQIKDIENEINRLAKLSRDNQLEDPDLRARFHQLLAQFMPCGIHEEMAMIQRQNAQLLMKNRKRRNIGDQADLQSRKLRLARIYASWVRDICFFGACIRIPPEKSITSMQMQLDFKVHTTGSGEDFRILGLDGQGSTAPLREYRIPSDVPNTRGFTIADHLIVREFERGINSLLNERSQSGQLTWDASESLLSKMRAILPIPLRDQEREHFAIDSRARQGPLSQEQGEEFWASWEKWNTALENWMQTIPNGRVIIDTGDNHPDPGTTIPLNVSDMSELRNLATPRPKVLPHPVKTMAQDLNDYLFGNFAELSATGQQKGDSLLWQWFRPICTHVRQQLISHVGEVYLTGGFDPENLTPEVDSLIESISLSCCSLYRDSVRSLKEVTIEEPVPGEYKLVHASILGPDGADNMSDVTENERIAAKLLETLCLDILTSAQREFLTIATKIRRKIALTPDEILQYFRNLSAVADMGLGVTSAASDAVANLAAKASQAEGLANPEKTYLLAADSLSLWYRWVLNSLPPETRLLLPPGAMRNMAQELLNKGSVKSLPGSVNPPPLEPPSAFEIQELQVELNNLLVREKMNLATPEMSKALEYLLREFLSPAVRLLKERIDMQREGSLGSLSGSMINSMGFLEAQKRFQSRFQQFKSELYSRFGVALDSWWYGEAVITAAVARWRFWKSVIKNKDGTPKYPITSKYLELEKQQEWFGIYALLTNWVSNGCPEDVTDDTRMRLILAALPDVSPSFSALQAQIRDTTQAMMHAADGLDDSAQAVFLLGIKEEFVKSYMQWYTSQLPSALQALRKEYAGTEDSHVDFAGKAERRGIQRAAIEIGLNLLASNQEQHRPADRFRVMDLSRTHVPLEKEIPISLPLEPSRRQEEQDAFEFTKKMLAYKEWKDCDYEVSRGKLIEDPSLIINPEDENLMTSYGNKAYPEDPQDDTMSYVLLDPPINYSGPFTIADAADAMATASRRQTELSRIALQLQSAYAEYPRPLLENLLNLIAQGMDASQSIRHRLYDDVPLTKQELDLLEEISGDSWDEIAQSYPDLHSTTNGFLDAGMSRLEEFEADLRKIDDIPLWTPPHGVITPPPPDENSHLWQVEYTPKIESQLGVTLDHLSLAFQKLKGNIPYIHQEMRQFLSAMKSAGRIHYDNRHGNERVSWIPFSGHPENKYVTSRGEALRFPYIRRNALDQLEVQYDAQGTVGPPIVQPNKYEHLQRVAFRLGRDTLRVLQTLQDPPIHPEQAVADQIKTARLTEEHMKHITPEERGQATPSSKVNLNDINLLNIAREVLSTAPHLATEMGIQIPYRNPHSSTPPVAAQLDETEAAALIQLKILEEINNNFEPKFPIDETVWDFADERLATETITRNGRTILLKKQQTKFFSVLRHPICCQTKAIKEAIKNSGPMIEEEPVVPVLTEEQQSEKCLAQRAKAAEEAAKWPLKKARHIRGQRPCYPFGETPYQEAYQSHVMEYELRDVEAFNPQPKCLTANLKAGIKNTLTKVFDTAEPIIVELPEDPPIPNDPHPLPRIPAGWKPDNISAEEKRLQLIELAKQTPGFPDPAIPEYYHTQEEIEVMRVREEHQRRLDEVAANDAEIAQVFGKTRDQVTLQQWAEWQKLLNISSSMGRRLTPVNATAGGPGATVRALSGVQAGHGLGRGQTASVPVLSGPRTGSLTARGRGSRTRGAGGRRGDRQRHSAPMYAPVSTGDSRRPSRASSGMTAGEYFREFEANGGSLPVEKDREDWPSLEDVEFVMGPPPLYAPTGSPIAPIAPDNKSPVGPPSSADQLGAEIMRKEALDEIGNQVIEEADIKAQMLREEADRALKNGDINSGRLQEEADKALEDAENLREEQRVKVLREMEEMARLEAELHASEDDDIENIHDDDDDLYGA